ncbi:restriction endonuclease subunit S [Bifidobacterium sp. ESL0682]|uniref:restriction endonuclease subunit S n=1 Tax=Bifidobacterium sp. ESL0682 TaxID=2983212 RepID=UPI0023F8B3E0|nr:restriction endonuclease subunit S [Bifidobacterium sp. ESL0682]WEV42427.1 restriction endonuclease subunit S [Bifidobacterium sp. ESL0682]
MSEQPKGQKLVPQLRFKGFNDPWEQRKLSELFNTTISNNTISRNSLTQTPSSVQDIHYGDILIKYPMLLNAQQENIPSILDTVNVSTGKRALQNGDIVIADTAEDSAVGRTIEIRGIWKGQKVVAGLHTVPLRPLNKMGIGYLAYAMNSPAYRKQLMGLMQGVKVLSLTRSSLFQTQLRYPNNIAEQSQIGEFFKTLDDLIAACERKTELLKKRKRYYLQQIFSQRLRFKGFTQPWQERKLGELFDERAERSAEGEMLSVTIGKGIVRSNELERKDNSSADKSNYKQVEPNDLAYNTMRMWQGACGVSKYSGIVSPAYTIAKPRMSTNPYFCNQLFKTNRALYVFRCFSQGLTSDTWNLKFPQFSDIGFKIPSKNEQDKINIFLTIFDLHISVNDKYIRLLNLKKQNYLHFLFI